MRVAIVTALLPALLWTAGAGAESAKLDQLRVNPMASAPRTASAVATSAAAADPRADALATRLRQQVAAIRARGAGSAAGARSATTQDILADFRRRAGDAAEVHFRPRIGTPMQIRGAILERGPAGGAAAAADRDEATARRFLAVNRDLLRLDDPDRELALRRRETDPLGRRHLRFVQIYRGLPVWPANVHVHLDAAGNVDLMEGAFVPTPRNVRLRPRLSSAAAIDRARAAVPGGAAAVASEPGLSEPGLSEPSLIIHAPGTAPPHLAWKLELSVSLTARWLVVVDAIRGTILTAFNQIATQAARGSGQDLLSLPGP